MQLVVGLTGSLSWLFLAWLRVRNIPTEWWRWRDDAVITLSHAKNFADYGSIGVSPGIDRVEGFSAPLQFLAASGYFRLGGQGYQGFLDWQTVIGVAASGALTSLVLFSIVNRYQPSHRFTFGIVVLGTLLVGSVTIGSWTTFAWLVSGMENVYVLTLGLAIVWARARSDKQSAPYLLAIGVLIALLGLSRIEMPFVMVPMLVAIAAWNLVPWSWTRFARSILLLSTPPLLLWGGYQIFRVTYFGQLLPNTALVQGKASVPQTNVIAAAIILLLFFGYFYLSLTASRRGTQLLTIGWLALSAISGMTWLIHSSATIAAIVGEISILAASPSSRLLETGIGGNGMLLALSTLLGGFQALALKRRAKPWPGDLLFASGAMLGLSQFMLFGPARLEPHRILSIAVPFLAIWIAATGIHLLCQRRSTTTAGTLVTLALGFSSFGSLFVLTSAIEQPVEDFCCWVSVESEVADVARDYADTYYSAGVLPITSSPDLGKLTFRKQSLHVDLGSIGDPLMTRIREERPDLVSTYLTDVVAPDVVQSHHFWSREYSDWFSSPEFGESWSLVNEDVLDLGPIEGWEDTIIGGRTGFWARQLTQKELGLTNELAIAADPAAVIESEIAACADTSIYPFACNYVTRAVWRNSLLLQAQGQYDGAIQAMAASPSFELDREILRRSPGWANRAYQEFEKLTDLNSRNIEASNTQAG